MRHISVKLFLISLIPLILLVSGCGYNTLQRQDEEVKAAWAEVLNQFKRRADLVPNLVKVVQGYAEHEKEVFAQVTEARTKVGSLSISPDLLNNPEAFEKFQHAQRGLSSAIARLLAVAENYPQLKADGAFRDLQAQIEGTENRIAVARGRYIKAVQEFNITVRSFPSNLTAKYFEFTVKPTFSVENEQELAKPPVVQF